ncbi:MAG: hypothetical protein WC943_07580 [Elusimicrobiota bacterium]|jgi:hypothetical protein
MNGPLIGRPAIPVPEARKVLGRVFVVSGLVHAFMMAYACAVALRWVPDLPSFVGWFDICFGHLAATLVLAAISVWAKSREGDLYTAQLVVDTAAGVIVFGALFAAAVLTLVYVLPVEYSAVSMLSSAWLAVYGAVLMRGSQVWSLLNL